MGYTSSEDSRTTIERVTAPFPLHNSTRRRSKIERRCHGIRSSSNPSTEPPNMHILNFPREVVQAICEQVDDTKTLVRISKCCKALHKIAIPLLYAQFIIDGTGVDGSIDRFLSTILNRPQLAQHVKKLTTTCLFWELEDEPAPLEDKYWFKVSSLLLRQYSFDENGFDKIESISWVAKLLGGRSLDATLSLLIYLLPQLTSLDISDFMHGEDISFRGELSDTLPRYLHSVMDRAARLQQNNVSNPCSLNNLKKIRLEYSFRTHQPNFEGLMKFISLPSVTSFTGHRLICLTCPIPEPSLRSTTITSISLTNSALSGLVFEHFLSLFPELVVFRYKHGGLDVSIASTLLIPPRIKAGLEKCKSTLEELLLIEHEEDRLKVDWDGLAKAEASQSIGSFAEYPRLKKLTITAYILIGKDNGILESRFSGSFSEYQKERIRLFLESLPPRLEELIITDCLAYEVWPMIDALLKQKQKFAPHLNTIRLDFQYGVINSHVVVGPHEIPQWAPLYQKFHAEMIFIDINGVLVCPSRACRHTGHRHFCLRLDE